MSTTTEATETTFRDVVLGIFDEHILIAPGVPHLTDQHAVALLTELAGRAGRTIGSNANLNTLRATARRRFHHIAEMRLAHHADGTASWVMPNGARNGIPSHRIHVTA